MSVASCLDGDAGGGPQGSGELLSRIGLNVQLRFRCPTPVYCQFLTPEQRGARNAERAAVTSRSNGSV